MKKYLIELIDATKNIDWEYIAKGNTIEEAIQDVKSWNEFEDTDEIVNIRLL